ncbi:MAG: preprotein translocase subunit SecE [Clostridiales bacterium]|jgi:preprotein translocase subunit SecE|nr:preprotein translocase subunit SecE [Clostridiales bacterium]
MAQAVERAKKPNRVKKFFTELFSELRKVTWPNFRTVLKQLWVVLLVVALFLVFISAVDYGLGLLYGLLVSHLPQASTTSAAIAAVL